ncbi:hypothetical protein DFH08DRAFT_962026 [Mycena albidolilacea]|uniref:Uncharacterized protein n=1 Tax=Mycena albidolilacea TaxID=1033008 RepID=A0AAD6ZY53_9AGAR|nr:hypothetical protein DFH08DRAFT_962026 [Mycena albidolilacea]
MPLNPTALFYVRHMALGFGPCAAAAAIVVRGRPSVPNHFIALFSTLISGLVDPYRDDPDTYRPIPQLHSSHHRPHVLCEFCILNFITSIVTFVHPFIPEVNPY